MKLFPAKDLTPKKVILLEEQELFSELAEKAGTNLFLGKYSINAVLAVLKKRNFFREAQKRGLWPLVSDLDSSEFPPLQRFRIYFHSKNPKNLIVDLKIKEGLYRVKDEIGFHLPLPEFWFLSLDWLTLQNPKQNFAEDKPQLPGQEHPGLSLGKKVLDLFIYLARLNRNDGILAYPAYFHNALLFSRYFYFINPEKKAEVLTLRQTFPKLSFKQLAWIVHYDCMKKNDGSTYEWRAEELVYPLNRLLMKYFNSKPYKKKFNEIHRKKSFFIDWECFEKKRGEIKQI
jgi:hypothetical protein